VDAFKAGCLGSGASSQTCDPITNDGRNTTCLDCLIEGRAGAKVTALLVSTDGMTVIPNVASCQAIADGHPECAVEVVRSASCHLRQCGKCNDNQLQECETFADNPSYGNCRTVPVTAACKKYMTVNVSGPCGGTTFDERYLAAAKALCAGGPTDGGTD
jgi:hypothetical protein